MNKYFDFKRFIKLLKMELSEKMSIILKFAAVTCLIIIVLWLLNKLFGNVSIPISERINYFLLSCIVTLFAAPFILYKNHNNPKKGISYASLPVSVNEKYVSMIINTIIMPATVLISLLCIDSIMILIDTCNFSESLFFSEHFFNEMWQEDLLIVLSMQPVFIFGNCFFIKNKEIKTGLSIASIYVVFFVAYLLLMKYADFHYTEWVFSNRIIIDKVVKWGFVSFNLCFLVASYFRIKTQQY